MPKKRKGNSTKQKPPSNTTRQSRDNKKAIATPAIETIRQIVDALKPYELSKSQRLKTYQSMMLDDSVSNAFSANSVLIEEAFSNYTVECNTISEKSKEAAKFLKWNLANLGGRQTVRSIARSGAEFKRDGIAPFEKTFKKAKGKYEGFWQLDQLTYIHPLSLDQNTPFTVENGGRDITEMRQSLSAFRNSSDLFTSNVHSHKGYISIPRNKLAFMTYSATDAQPFGVSAFDACYVAWREKVLLQDYTLVGVTKDMAGMPCLFIPEDILAEAAADPTSEAGIMVAELKKNMANMHSGDQNYTILPSDTQSDSGTGAKAFDIKFLGVEGGGKAYDPTELVEQRKRAIYNAFAASHLLAGEAGGGSYNLISGQANIHAHFLSRDISVIEEAWNSEIIPQLFRLNEWDLELEDLPRLKAGDVEPISADEAGKALQRIGAAGMAPIRDPKFLNEVYDKLGYSYRFKEDITPEEVSEMTGEPTSRAGEGMEEGLPSGTGKATGGGDTSSTNSDNK